MNEINSLKSRGRKYAFQARVVTEGVGSYVYTFSATSQEEAEEMAREEHGPEANVFVQYVLR